ncbi:hypothetical protein WA016_05519 [Myxococcus stipitatus]
MLPGIRAGESETRGASRARSALARGASSARGGGVSAADPTDGCASWSCAAELIASLRAPLGGSIAMLGVPLRVPLGRRAAVSTAVFRAPLGGGVVVPVVSLRAPLGGSIAMPGVSLRASSGGGAAIPAVSLRAPFGGGAAIPAVSLRAPFGGGAAIPAVSLRASSGGGAAIPVVLLRAPFSGDATAIRWRVMESVRASLEVGSVVALDGGPRALFRGCVPGPRGASLRSGADGSTGDATSTSTQVSSVPWGDSSRVGGRRAGRGAPVSTHPMSPCKARLMASAASSRRWVAGGMVRVSNPADSARPGKRGGRVGNPRAPA